MTQEQFYTCLQRILELREKIEKTYLVRRNAQVLESYQAAEQHVGFNALKKFAENKESADKNTAEANALLKELAKQEAKIRAFVPVSIYGVTIDAVQPGQPTLYIIVDAHQISVSKAAL